MLSKLQWKMPTWKGLAGLLGLGYVVVCQLANVGGLAPSSKATIATLSAALLAVERYCDSQDNKVAAGATPATPATQPPPIVPPTP